MREGLEASPQYDEELQRVRDMASEEKSGQERQEQAKLLRMERLLDNAEVAQRLTEYLEENPSAEIADLLEYAQGTGLVSEPKVLEHFIEGLNWGKRDVYYAKEHLDLWSKESGMSTENVVFNLLRETDGYSGSPILAGSLELDLDYPLAIVLYVENQDDYNQIDPRTNIGGFYGKQTYKVKTKDNQGNEVVRSCKLPVIVVNGKKAETEKIVDHEKGHAENQPAMQTLKYAHRKTVWSEKSFFSIRERELAVQFLEANVELGIEVLKNTTEWAKLFNTALSSAKDEFLAEFKATDGSTSGHFVSLKEREGVYDYFAKYGIKPDSPLYNALWSEYEKILHQAQGAIRKLRKYYHNTIVLSMERVNRLRWVLAQIPIQDWDDQIKGTLFYEEIDELMELSQLVSEALATEKESSKKVMLIHTFYDAIDKIPNHKPLLPYLKEFKHALASIDSETK